MTARRAAAIRWASLALIGFGVLLVMRAAPTERILDVAQTWIDGLGVWGPLALGAIYILAALLFVPGSLLTLAAGAIYGLVLGTIVVSLASTTAAALAFLISRHLARDAVRRKIERSPRLAAVDEAIGEQSWKIVALLRLSPAVPFTLQNYLYGVTAVRFWPAVLASWAAMLPGTFMFVYLGSLGRTAAAGRETSAAEWALRAIGLLATIAVTAYVTRLARKAIHQRTKIAGADEGYGRDFKQHAPTTLEYASRSAPALRQAIAKGQVPRVRWLDYDWRLNSRGNRDHGSTDAPRVECPSPARRCSAFRHNAEVSALSGFNVGVTSGGDLFGGTQISYTDVLGDQQFNIFAASVSQYRTLSASYTNLERRLQWAVQGYSQTQFFFGQVEGLFFDPAFSGLIDRDLAVATRTLRGATAFAIYPLNRYRRLELYGGVANYQERFENPDLEAFSREFQQEQFGETLFNNGTIVPVGITFVQETTIFREFGPLAGSTMRINYEGAPKIGNALSRQTIDIDARKYLRLGASGLFAVRARLP